jgi:hypothetical protein
VGLEVGVALLRLDAPPVGNNVVDVLLRLVAPTVGNNVREALAIEEGYDVGDAELDAVDNRGE